MAMGCVKCVGIAQSVQMEKKDWSDVAVLMGPILIFCFSRTSRVSSSGSASRCLGRARADLTATLIQRSRGSLSRATHMSAPDAHGGKRDVSLVVGNYVSLFETRCWSIHTFAGGPTERRKVGTLPLWLRPLGATRQPSEIPTANRTSYKIQLWCAMRSHLGCHIPKRTVP